MSEPTTYATVAAELHRIADDLAAMATDGLAQPWLGLSFQTRADAEDDATKVRTVDAIANALLGHSAEPRELTSGKWHHTAQGYRGGISLSVFEGVADPARRERDAELVRVRAELAAARAELAGAYHPAVRRQIRTVDSVTSPEVCDVDHENPIDVDA